MFCVVLVNCCYTIGRVTRGEDEVNSEVFSVYLDSLLA